MSAIFISHASNDNAFATRLRYWLENQGHRSLFMDFDSEFGIAAGQKWEQELYKHLRECRAVIVLCSENSMSSRWCFAEIIFAKALSKHIIPLVIEPCKVDPMLSDSQTIYMINDWQEGLDRLLIGLSAAGIDVVEGKPWDGSRAPYPGLLAFQEEDAAVFFGRDKDINNVLNALNQARRYGDEGLVILLGASGSGKSSLMRAGILPLLRRDPEQWLVIDPFRLGEQPIRNLASSLAKRLCIDWRQVEQDLSAASDPSDSPETFAKLRDIATELRVSSGKLESTIVIPIDQFEELLSYPPDHPANRFLHLLRATLDRLRGEFLFLATLRSDFLATFQQHPVTQDLAFKGIPLGAIPKEGLVQIIEKPAILSGLELESGLVPAIVDDTGTDHALPLLAFTLRELYEECKKEGAFKIKAYREKVGGLQGSIAKVADGLLESLRIKAEDEMQLRRALLTMVRVDEEGHYVRRSVFWEELPKQIHPVLEKFVKARLLVSRGDNTRRTLEVAHETLFWTWTKLADWLNENKDFLVWKDRMTPECRAWKAASESDRPGLLLTGRRLDDAREWLSKRQDDLGEDARQFITESNSAKQEFEARQRKTAERIASQRRWLVAAFFIVSALAVYGFWQKHKAELAAHEERLARNATRAGELAIRAAGLVNTPGNMALAGMLAAESLNFAHTLEGQQVLAKILALTPRQVQTIGLEEQNIILSPDNRLMLNWPNRSEKPASGSVSLLDPDTMKTVKTWKLEGTVWPVFDPNGKMMAIAGHARRLLVIDLATRELVLDDYYPSLIDAEFSSDGHRLYVARADGVLETRIAPDWRKDQEIRFASPKKPFYRVALSVAKELGPLMIHSTQGTFVLTKVDEKVELLQDVKPGEFVSFSAMDQNGQRVFSAIEKDWQNNATLWDLKKRQVITRLEYESRVNVAMFSPDGSRLAIGTEEGGIHLWDAQTGKKLASFAARKSVNTLDFSADGSLLATGDDNGDTSLWDIKALKDAPVWNLEYSDPVDEVSFSDDGHTLLIADQTKTLRRVSIATRKALIKNHIAGQVLAIAGVKSSPVLAIGVRESEDNEAWAGLQARDAKTGQLKWSIAHNGHFRTLAFNPDARTFATSTNGTEEIKIWDADTGKLLYTPPVTGWKLDYTADGTRLVVTSNNNISVIDPLSGQLLSTIGEPGGVSKAVYPSRDGSLITYGDDDTFRAWDVKNGKALWRRSNPFPNWSGPWLSPDGQTFALQSGEDGRLRIFETSSDRQLSEIPGSGLKKWQERLTFSPGGDRLLRILGPLYSRKNKSQDPDSQLSATEEEKVSYFQVELWEPSSGKKISTKQINGLPYINVKFLRSGQLAIVPENNEQADLEVLDTRNGRLLWKIPAYKNYIYSQHYEHGDSGIFTLQGPNAPVLFGGPKFTELRDRNTGRVLARHDRPISRTNVIHDASWVISLYFDVEQSGHRAGCSASLWNWKTGQERWRKRWSDSEDCGFGDAAVSLDGKQLLLHAYGANGDLIALDLQSGQSVGAIKTGSIEAFWPLPDSDQVLTQDFNGSVRAWRLSTGKEIQSFAHGRSAYGVAVAAQAKRAVTYTDYSLRVWNLDDLSLVATYQCEDKVSAVSFRSDGQQIAYTSGEGIGRRTALSILNVADKTSKAIPLESGVESGGIENIGYDSTGTKLKATIDSKRGRVWSASSLQPMLTVEPLTDGKINSLSFSSDGTRLQVEEKGGYRIWDIKSGLEIARLDGYGIREVPNTSDFLLHDKSGWQKWNIKSGDFENIMSDSPYWVSLAFPRSNLLAGKSDEKFLVLDIKSGTTRSYRPMPSTEEFIAHAFSAQHELVAFSQRKKNPYRPGGISLRRLPNGSEETSAQLDAVVTELKFADGDDSLILLGTPGGWANYGEGISLYLWRWRSDKLVPLSGKQPIISVAVSPNSSLLVTSEGITSNRTLEYRSVDPIKTIGTIQLRVWDARTGKVIQRLVRKHLADALAFSTDGHHLAAAEAGGIALFDTHSWSPIRTLLPKGGWIGNQVSFAVGNRIIAKVQQSYPSGEGNQGIGVWSMNGTLERVLETTTGVDYFVLSADGKTVAVKAGKEVAGNQDILSIFDVESGTELIRHQFADLQSIALGGDNNDLYVVVGQSQRSLIKIPWRTQDLISEVCRRIHRRPSEQEQRHYLSDVQRLACDSSSAKPAQSASKNLLTKLKTAVQTVRNVHQIT